MRPPTLGRKTAFVVLRSLAAVPVALTLVGGAQARPQTTTPTNVLRIHVTITDARITLDRHSAPGGVNGRFVLENVGTRKHNFTLEGGALGSTAFTRTVGPHRHATISLFLDYRGTARYLDRLPADRNNAQMRGVFVVR